MKSNLSVLTSLFLCFGIHAIDYHDYPPVPEEEQKIDQSLPISDVFDMESIVQDFILETKRIEFSEYPNAFNPSIIKWRGGLLMSFRVYNPINGSTNPFALVWLNENFEPITIPQLFELPFHNPVLPSKQQDPRLISIGERLFIVYNNILESITHREMRRIFIVELFYDGEKFTASEPECLVDFEGKNEMRYEKNWVPFDYNGELFLSYSITPHRIFRPCLGEGACETIANTPTKFKWDWGTVRGGTQALLDGDHYLAFFHSWVDRPTVQSNGKKISHYVMGAYTFQSQPPFSVIAISPEPIVAENFYRPPYYKTWKPMRCIFPAGMIFDESAIWVSYGRQDHEIWIAKLDKKKLLQSLVPVSAE